MIIRKKRKIEKSFSDRKQDTSSCFCQSFFSLRNDPSRTFKHILSRYNPNRTPLFCLLKRFLASYIPHFFIFYSIWIYPLSSYFIKIINGSWFIIETKKEINLNLRRFNIIPKMRHLSGKIYSDFESALRYLKDSELRDYNNFLLEIQYKINRLEKMQKRLF